MSTAIRRPFTAVLVAALAGGRAGAQQPVVQPPAPLTLRAALAAARRANPDLLAARLREDSAGGERRIARALPNPTGAVVPNVPTQLQLTEPLDLTPARLYRTRAARLGEDASRFDAADADRQVTFAVRQAFYDVLLAQALRDVAATRRGALGRLLAADSARLRAGDVPERNVARSELELARADAALARAVTEVHASRLALSQLLGAVRPDTGLAVAGALAYRPLPIDTAGLAPAAVLAARPDVLGAATRVGQARAAVATARAALVPTPQLTYVAQRHQPFESGRFYMFGLGAQLPLAYLYAGERQRARAGLAAAEVARARAARQAGADLAGALDQYRTARALAERYAGGLLAKADAGVETARYAYRAGAASQLEVLDAVRTAADTRAEYCQAVRDYWVGVFALERAAGRDLAGPGADDAPALADAAPNVVPNVVPNALPDPAPARRPAP